MPVIIQLGKLKVQVFSNDHNPPHFHVSSPDYDAMVLISDLSVLQGRIASRDLETVIEWASVPDKKRNGVASMSDDIISVGTPLPRIAAAKWLGKRVVRVTWKSGDVSVVDLAPALLSRRFYIPLRDDDVLFAKLRVEEYGTAIEWPGDIDFSALWLSKLPSVEFDNEAFREAMDDLGMTLDGMAAALEISRRQVADYRKEKPIPRNVAYATRYLVEAAHKDDNHAQKMIA